MRNEKTTCCLCKWYQHKKDFSHTPSGYHVSGWGSCHAERIVNIEKGTLIFPIVNDTDFCSKFESYEDEACDPNDQKEWTQWPGTNPPNFGEYLVTVKDDENRFEIKMATYTPSGWYCTGSGRRYVVAFRELPEIWAGAEI